MTLKSFLEENGITTTGIEIKKTEKTYSGTSVQIMYINLPKYVDGQDYLVFSRHLAEKVLDDKSFLKKAEAKKTTEGWGLICPTTVEVFATIDL